MRRFNYLGVDRRAQLEGALETVCAPRLRRAVVLCALAVSTIGGLRAFEDQRIAQAQGRLDVAQVRAAAVAAARRRVAAISTDVTRLTRLEERVRALRRSGFERAQELARIGGMLPAHVWLTAIRDKNSDWELEGGALSLADVGTAMLALERAPRIASASLLWAQVGTGNDPTLRYQMRLARSP
jgi:hypothetical protein